MSGVRPEPKPEDTGAAIAPVSLAALLLPIVTAIAALLIVFLFVSHDAAAEVLWKAITTATVAGKFAVLLYEPGKFLSTPYHMACLVVYMDLTIGFISVFNFGLLFRIPAFGNKLQEIRSFGGFMLRRNPWMRKATFAGTCAFVMFPLSGTGAIAGSFLGQLLGMSRARTMFAILVGAIIGAFGLAALTGFLPEGIKDSLVFKLGGLVVILATVALLTKLYKKIDVSAIGNDDGSLEGTPGEVGAGTPGQDAEEGPTS
jgi:hypothetical protein